MALFNGPAPMAWQWGKAAAHHARPSAVGRSWQLGIYPALFLKKPTVGLSFVTTGTGAGHGAGGRTIPCNVRGEGGHSLVMLEGREENPL